MVLLNTPTQDASQVYRDSECNSDVEIPHITTAFERDVCAINKCFEDGLNKCNAYVKCFVMLLFMAANNSLVLDTHSLLWKP